MTELMKRYEAETGKSSMQSITDGIHCVSIDVWHYEYVAWLEHRLLKLERSIRALVRVINITDVPIPPAPEGEFMISVSENMADKVKQIGNAVPPKIAEALAGGAW